MACGPIKCKGDRIALSQSAWCRSARETATELPAVVLEPLPSLFACRCWRCWSGAACWRCWARACRSGAAS